MTDVINYQGKIAGAALLLAMLSFGVSLIIIAVQGKLGGLAAAFTPVESIGESASALSTLAKASLPSTLFHVIGFGLLAVKLNEKGEASLAAISFTLVLLAVMFMAIKVAFDESLTAWAAQQWARTGRVPEVYEPLRAWVRSVFGLAYVAYFVSMAGFGWGILRADLLAPWVGWAAMGWSLVWIAGYVFQVGLPAFIVVPPIIYGIGLLVY